ncbi:MAG: hypothetical protein IPI77_17090 [Saprospiraceae bacterium]|nr:hypothetical protein [Saprospiraceae bacterium]
MESPILLLVRIQCLFLMKRKGYLFRPRSVLKNYIGSNIFNDGTLESSKDNLGRVGEFFGTGVFVKIPLAGGGFKV